MNNGVHVHTSNPIYLQAVSEHEHLHAAVDRIHESLVSYSATAVDAAAIESVRRQIAALREQLQKHFAQEELGGYLEEALTRSPVLAPQASVLQRQHAEFLTLASQMLSDAVCCDPPHVTWERLKSDYELFAKRLKGHEAAENRLLQRAFNEDQGVDP